MPDEFQCDKSSSLTSTNIITEPGMFTNIVLNKNMIFPDNFIYISI